VAKKTVGLLISRVQMEWWDADSLKNRIPHAGKGKMEFNKKYYRVISVTRDKSRIHHLCIVYDLELEKDSVRKFEFYEIGTSQSYSPHVESPTLENPFPLDFVLEKNAGDLDDKKVIEEFLLKSVPEYDYCEIGKPQELKDIKTERFEQLQQPWMDAQYATDYYGINIAQINWLDQAQAWANTTFRSVQLLKNGAIHRYLFETYLYSFKLTPVKFAAAKLGTDVPSLNGLLSKLKESGMPLINPFDSSSQFISIAFVKDILQYFPKLSHDLFGNHDEYCRAMHNAIRSEFGIQVKKLKCQTSKALKEKNTLFAYSYDILTYMPVSIRYAISLSFGKPMSLEPDCCSAHIYYENRYILRNFLMAGYEPDVVEYIAQKYKEATRK